MIIVYFYKYFKDIKMKQFSKNKERIKISQFSNIIKKNENKEKITNKNKENKAIYLNKGNEILNIRNIKLRKNKSKKELEFNNKALFNSLNYKNNNMKSYRDEPKILLHIIIIFLLISLTNEFLLLRQLNYFCSVKITFKDSGINQFLGQNYKFKPDYVWVNEHQIEYQESIEGKYTILLNENEYTIKVGWNDPPTSCSNMFNGIQGIIAIDLSEFDSSKVVDMSNMFSECTFLSSLDLRNIQISSVTNFNSMFQSCYSLTKIDLSNLDASSAITMNGMFSHCTSLTDINLSNLKLGAVKDMSYLFFQCNSVSKIDFLDLDTTTVETMSHMFTQCTALKSLNLLNFDTSSVTDMEEMFSNTCNLESLDLSNFNTKSLISMKKMFFNSLYLKHLDISSFDTLSVRDMSDVFNSCSNLETIDISSFRTTKYTNTYGLFQNCVNLKSIIFPTKNKLLSNNFNFLFHGCRSLTSLDLSYFDTSSVTNMEYMFNNCIELIYVNLSLIDTSSVETMAYMFQNCEKLERIDLSKLNIASLKSMNNMFNNCNSLLFVNLKSLKISGIDLSDMFKIDTNKNLQLCYDENLASDLKTKFPSLPNNCSNPCFKESTKIISELNKCVEDCSTEGGIYINEFNYKCYVKCPENTTLSNFKCIQTSLSCEHYSNLDITQCFETVPEGYYIYDDDNKIIDECYKSCKTCNGKGDDNINNCIACKEGYFYEYGNCVEKCKYNSFLNDSFIEVCTCPLNVKCRECSDESLKSNLCITCNREGKYFAKYSEINYDFMDCYQSLEGYYLNADYFFPCYETCKECTIEGNEILHRCTKCKSGYKFKDEINDSNCYKICDYFYYFDESNKHKCTDSYQCPSYKSKLIEEKGKCVKNCKDDDKFQYEYNNKCYEECPDKENKIIENYICIDKAEEKITEIITDKINKEEKAQIPTSQAIEITEKAHNEIITNNTVIPTDIKTEKTTIHVTPTNSPTSKITQNTEKIIDIKTQDTEKIIDIKTQNNEEKENWNAENFFLGLPNENNNEILNKDEIIKNIKENIINHKIDPLLSNVIQGNKEDLSIKEDKVLYQITTTENQNNNTYNNISTIKLGKCEDILRLKYNISSNLPLIIFKIDYYMEGLLIPIIGYEVYDPINKTKLDLSCCEDSLISYNIPVSIDEDNLFKYNPNSEYYTDECNTYTTKDGTDIILNDRKEDFVENNMSLCENLCDYMGYDKDTKKALCECGIRYKEFLLSEIDKQTDLLSNNFTKDDTKSNLGTMKCYEVLFSKEGLLTNIGNYILLLIIAIHTVSTVIFYKCGYYFLENNIKNIIKKKKKLNPNKSQKKSRNETKNKTKNISPKQKSEKIKLKVKVKVKKKTNKNKANPVKKVKNKKSLVINQVNININNPNNNNINNSKSLSKIKLKDTDIFSPTSKKNLNRLRKLNKDKKEKKSNKSLLWNKYSDLELNLMNYNDALLIDRRTYFQYYFSLLKIKHPIFFTFFSNKDYNTLIIKICLFSLSFAIYYAFNAIFFNYSIIHIIYKDGGSYNLSYLFPLIVYAFLISYYINVIIKYFSLSERNLLELKNEKSIKKTNNLVPRVLRCLTIKYISYFALSIIFLSFLWYYISSFGAVFQNSQVYLIKNTFISFSLGLIYPFLIYLLPGIFRRISLRSNNRKYIYIISNILQNL